MSHYEEKQAWLSSLKVGDIVGKTNGVGVPAAYKIERLTATQIIIGNMRFAKKDGYAIGSYARFSRPRLVEITDSVREEIELKNLRSWASMRNWNQSTIEQMRAMKTAHDAAAVINHKE